jgi:AcrR family transcriptional regulator
VRPHKIDVSRTRIGRLAFWRAFLGGPMAEMQSRGELRNNKLQKVAANLFLKHGYDGVTIDKIVETAGGSKSTVYSEFGGKCGLFIKSIETLCRESNESLAQIDYEGLDLEQSLKKLGFQILKLITSKRSVELHRLAIGEAASCPEVGEAWYTHGPARTASFIMAVLERHREELRHTTAYQERIAVMLHDSLTGDILNRHLAGISKHESDADLQRTAKTVVEVVLAAIR